MPISALIKRRNRLELKLCECGCGDLINKWDNENRKMKYKRTHGRRVKWSFVKCENCNTQLIRKPSSIKGRVFCGMECSGAFTTKTRSGVNHPMFGKPSQLKGISPSEKTRLLISVANSGEKNGMYGKISYMKGKHHSEKTKQILRESRLNLMFPKINSFPERKLQSVLSVNNIPFKKHVPLTGQPDIFIEPNICIFVDGCYWHGCTNQDCKTGRKTLKRKLESRQIQKIISDNKNTKTLCYQGYKVIRIWEHEVQNNPLNILEKING